MKNKIKYYNSHGKFMSVKDFIELEVYDRGNYTRREIERIFWRSGLELNLNFKCIWVTNDKQIALSYARDNSKPEDTVFEVDIEEGVILFETNDGDNGYLFVQKKPKPFRVTRSNFINWFFADETIDVAITKVDLIADLIGAGESIITAQDLLNGCDYIPKHIVENPEDYPNNCDVSGSECLMKFNFK
jgi:hypothetical protein